MPVTQKDIANNLGVSRELVKFALSGNGRVGASNRERILQEAERLGYRNSSNQEARSLAARRNGKKIQNNIIALVTSNPLFEGMPVAGTPFFREIVRGIEEVVSRCEVDLLFCTFNATHRPRMILAGGVDGVICLGSSEIELHELAQPFPIVVFEPTVGQKHSVTPDSKTGGRLATEHLLALGHRRIACLSYSAILPEQTRDAIERVEGYREALAAAGIAYDENLVGRHVTHPSVEGGIEGMNHLLRSGRSDFTALVCFNDLVAMGAIQVLRREGRSVPEDVSVVGFDDVSAQHGFEPRLTSIRFDRFSMGMRAAQMICDFRDVIQDESSPTIHEVFPVELVVYDSTTPLLEGRS